MDTHAFVWAVTASDRLSVAARSAIQEPSVELLISPASAWEISTKHRTGKWPEVTVLLRQYESARERLGAHELSITTGHALAAGQLEWSHRDPFDRMLAVQALSEGVALVTADAVFRQLPGLSTLW